MARPDRPSRPRWLAPHPFGRFRAGCLAALGAGSLVCLATLGGCGGDDDDSADTPRSETRHEITAPKPTSSARRARSALAAGKKACRGRSATDVRDRYLRRAARARGRAVSRDYVRFAKNAPPELQRKRQFAQVAATIYAATRPRAVRRDAFSGCLYELYVKDDESR